MIFIILYTILYFTFISLFFPTSLFLVFFIFLSVFGFQFFHSVLLFFKYFRILQKILFTDIFLDRTHGHFFLFFSAFWLLFRCKSGYIYRATHKSTHRDTLRASAHRQLSSRSLVNLRRNRARPTGAVLARQGPLIVPTGERTIYGEYFSWWEIKA